jgi:hypothetical protein
MLALHKKIENKGSQMEHTKKYLVKKVVKMLTVHSRQMLLMLFVCYLMLDYINK